ncbi:MAG: hypothetical protein Q7J57_16535 [Gemmobacter sp.]|nr:hypothetical protein [Gemmobacter sp.]
MRTPRPTGPRVERLHNGGFQVLGLPDLSPVFSTRAKGEQWLRDHLQKLPATRQPRDRACLCCGTDFRSDGAHNRMCSSCRLRGQDIPAAVGLATASSKLRRAARV